jgi:hypothetical protein
MRRLDLGHERATIHCMREEGDKPIYLDPAGNLTSHEDHMIDGARLFIRNFGPHLQVVSGVAAAIPTTTFGRLQLLDEGVGDHPIPIYRVYCVWKRVVARTRWARDEANSRPGGPFDGEQHGIEPAIL